MKTLACIIVTFFSLSASAQSAFEGVMEIATYNLATKDEAVVKWFSKAGSNRLDVKGVADGKAYNTTMLFLKGDPMLYMYSGEGENKSIVTVPQASIAATQLTGVQVVRGDGKKTIAGYHCAEVKIETASGVIACWVTDELKIDDKSLPPTLLSSGIIGVLRNNGVSGIPVDVISRDTGGTVSFSFSVKSVTAKTLDAALFAIPSGYQSAEEMIKKSMEVK